MSSAIDYLRADGDAAPATAPRAASAGVAVEELRERGALSSLRGDWERLTAAMAAAGLTRGPFLSPEWFSIYAASLAPDGALRLLVAHRAGRVVAALPLYATTRKLGGVPARVLCGLADDHSQRFDLVADPADATAAARAIVAHLARARDWDAVELPSIPVEGAAADALVDAARAAGLPTGDWPSMVSPFLPLPASAAALDRQLGSKFRGNLRRRAKKLEAALGPLALERVDGSGLSAVALDAALDEGFALEAAGWKGELGTAIACDPQLAARYRALGHAFAARGQLACYFLRSGERRLAFHFALADGATYYLFKPGFDPSLAAFGPGHLIVDAVARDLIARGIGELDFLGDDMPWKRDWTDRARAHRFRYLFAPTARGRALCAWKFTLAPYAKRLWSRLRR